MATRTTETCVQCGYSLRGLPTSHYTCPECGANYDCSVRHIAEIDPYVREQRLSFTERLTAIGRRVAAHWWVLLFILLMSIAAALLKSANPVY